MRLIILMNISSDYLSQESYKLKYIKYKLKYNNLKKNIQSGGSNKNPDVVNTSRFQKRKDIFEENEIEECEKSVRYGPDYKTNEKFDKFNQLYYHAGDEEDLKNYGIEPIKSYLKAIKPREIKMKNSNVFKDSNISISKLYNNNNLHTIEQTLLYIYRKFKKGLLVFIKDQELKIYLPFSNVNYKNEFEEKLLIDDEKEIDLEKLKKLKMKNSLGLKDKERKKNLEKKFRRNLINFSNKNRRKYLFDRSKWVANNCIFRNTYPEYEGDKLTSEYRYLLNELLKYRKIPDVTFFLNLRDFPILKEDLTEPYEDIYNSKTKKMDKKYINKNYTPILSRSKTDKHADILLPTEDDILRISNKIFPDKCNTGYTKSSRLDIETNWSKKIDKAIFMGQATGCGITLKDNMRLKAADMSLKYPEHLVAGITGWNKRLKKSFGNKLNIIDPKEFNFSLSQKMSRNEISKYKYQLEIDGHVSAFRLSFDMSYNSVILLVESKYKIWFSHLLEPYKHYIPIKSDLSDLISQIEWCRKNDKKCEEIASNAKNFYDKYLSKDGILDYLQSLFIKLSKLK